MMTTGFSANDDNYLLLRGPDDAPIFLFIHGYGSAPQDLLPLARYINSQSYNCALLLLRGHTGESASMAGLQYSDFLNQARKFYSYYRNVYSTIYLVGFSLGATLSLNIALEEQVAGVVAISAFLKPPKLSRAIIHFASRLGFRRVPRLLQVTSKKTKAELYYSKHFLVAETLALIEALPGITPRLMHIHCPILFLHSIDDRVADYWSTAALVQNIPSHRTFLVTFRCLKHFLHFDAPLSSWFLLINAFFWPTKSAAGPLQYDSLRGAWDHASEELRHWSGIIFQLMVGFFSIFGTLIYFSLPDVLAKADGAPYYLLVYSILTSFFFVLYALYFFYINRVNVFLKHHVEPYLSESSWTAYRTSRTFAGKESERMTERSFLAVVGLPLAISVGSVVYALVEYQEEFSLERGNMLLTLGMGIAISLIFSSMGSMLALAKYTRRELYRLPVVRASSSQLKAAVQELYLSVSPGVVSQDAGDKRRSVGQLFKSWLQIAAILIAGAIVVSYFANTFPPRRKPAQVNVQPAQANVQLDLKKVGAKNGNLAVQLSIITENPSMRPIYTLPAIYRVWAVRNASNTLDAAEFEKIAREQVQRTKDGMVGRFSSEVESTLIAVGRFSTDWHLDPGERVLRTAVIQIPQDAYDSLISTFSLPVSHQARGLSMEWDPVEIEKSKLYYNPGNDSRGQGTPVDWQDPAFRDTTGFAFVTARAVLSLWELKPTREGRIAPGVDAE